MPRRQPPAASFCAAALAAAALAAARSASAQSLEVAPISVELAAGQATSSVTLVNHADAPSTIQVRAFRWTQEGGEDRLTATKDLLTSPPFTTLGAGESQIVRLLLRQPAAAGETAYRILIDQLPSAAAPGAVRVALRISLPIFAESGVRAAPALQAAVSAGPGDGAFLILRNTGGRRIRLAQIRLLRSDGGVAPKLEADVFSYVLAGSERRLRLVWPAAARDVRGRLRMTAKSDGGAVELDAPVEP